MKFTDMARHIGIMIVIMLGIRIILYPIIWIRDAWVEAPTTKSPAPAVLTSGAETRPGALAFDKDGNAIAVQRSQIDSPLPLTQAFLQTVRPGGPQAQKPAQTDTGPLLQPKPLFAGQTIFDLDPVTKKHKIIVIPATGEGITVEQAPGDEYYFGKMKWEADVRPRPLPVIDRFTGKKKTPPVLRVDWYDTHLQLVNTTYIPTDASPPDGDDRNRVVPWKKPEGDGSPVKGGTLIPFMVISSLPNGHGQYQEYKLLNSRWIVRRWETWTSPGICNDSGVLMSIRLNADGHSYETPLPPKSGEWHNGLRYE